MNKFAEWHLAWLAERPHYAEYRNKLTEECAIFARKFTFNFDCKGKVNHWGP